jgi:cytochrome c553
MLSTSFSKFALTASLASVALLGLSLQAADSAEPLWAYGFTAPAAPGEKATLPGPPTRALKPNEDPAQMNRKRTIAGSTGEYSLVEIRNGNEVVDWFPGEHPPLTPIMKHGPSSLGTSGYGCAFCHMPNGKGRPENAPVAGLNEAYFIRQMHDFRNGLRSSSEPRKANTLLMIVSTGMFLPIEADPTEDLAGRIMEMPEKPEDTELLRHPHSGFVAYVPVGSLKTGEALVTTGGATIVDGKPVAGKTVACGTCHGPDLRGMAEVPGIAGRSPSYIARQMYDMQQGTRKSPLSQLMQPVVAHLNSDDFVAIAAYVSSLAPRSH